MRKMLFTAAVALLGFAGSALADGTIVRWNAVVGLQGHEGGGPNLIVGGTFYPNTSWFWVEGGRVQLNLDTGQVQIQIRHVSWAAQGQGINDNPIGSPLNGTPFKRTGTFVCDAAGHHNAFTWVSTEVVYFDDTTGSLNYQGRVDVPQACRDYPDQIAFLFGGAGTYNYFAYGTARELLTSNHGHD